jgi:hypothetical protein
MRAEGNVLGVVLGAGGMWLKEKGLLARVRIGVTRVNASSSMAADEHR